MSVTLDQLKVALDITYLSIHLVSFVLFLGVSKRILQSRKCNLFCSFQMPELLYKSLAAKLVVGMPFKVYVISILDFAIFEDSTSKDIHLTSFIPLI